MSDNAATSALQRFARDLRRIREDRGISLAAIHGATQVPVSDLEAFESGALFQRSTMSPVYLRAFVQSYARAVDLPTDVVEGHLASARGDDYQNQLAVRFLDVSPTPPQTDPENAGPSEPEAGRATDEEGIHDSGARSSEADSESRGAAAAGKNSPARSKPFSEATTEASGTNAEGDAKKPGQSERGATPALSGNGSVVSVRPRTVAVAALVLLAIAGGAGLLVFFAGGNAEAPSRGPDPTGEGDASPAETTRAASPVDTAQSARLPLSDVVLGDTVHVTVVATADVRELRVQQDDKLRRPYWIEEGEAMVFPFTRRITVENQMGRFRLLLERYPYPTTRRDTEGRIVIDRAAAQRFADTLRATAASVPAVSDTTYGNAPDVTPDPASSDPTAPSGSAPRRR